jgi:poly(hydroxyalkanoate) depolymerase family esterase
MDGLSRLPKGLDRIQTAAPAQTLPAGAAFRSETHTGSTGSRAYRHYVPASAQEGVAGIVLMLHGCTQTPEDFATGTDMNALAEKHRLVVIYPEQARGANMQTCWNWFSKGDQRRDRGEPEILAGITRKAMEEHGIPPERVFVAGLSAGAAMAVILGETYPDLFAAVGAHSGLPFGAAHDLPTAFAAMAGDLQHASTAADSRRAPRTIVFHGTTDRTVHPANGVEIARRAGRAPGTQVVETVQSGERNGRRFQLMQCRDAGGYVIAEHWQIDALGHAWSGGNGAGSYADPSGPDASAEMIRFFLDPTAEGAQ